MVERLEEEVLGSTFGSRRLYGCIFVDSEGVWLAAWEQRTSERAYICGSGYCIARAPFPFDGRMKHHVNQSCRVTM